MGTPVGVGQDLSRYSGLDLRDRSTLPTQNEFSHRLLKARAPERLAAYSSR